VIITGMPQPIYPASEKYLIVILGPTAIGKTGLAIDLAEKIGSEIISADSRQFYKELKIGVASPDKEQLARIKHHYIGQLSVIDDFNVSRYETEVLDLLEKLFKRNKYVIMSGGSGLYIDAVCKGIDELPDPDPTLRDALNESYKLNGIEILQDQLAVLDPEYFEKVDKNNPKRLMRALEVCITTGRKYSELRKNTPKQRSFRIIKIGLNCEREILFKRIESRVNKMIESGLVEEVGSLIQYRHLNALNTVGYKEIFKYLDGSISLDQAITDIKTNTRRYAKRQLVWFKKDPEIRWFHPEGLKDILNWLENQE
jgi:tRNA dimethylallyltransferase